MKKAILYLLFINLLWGCENSKWETIYGQGIDDKPKTFVMIYFENENKGVVGGYTLIADNNSKLAVKLSHVPILFLTQDGGKHWKEIKFDSGLKQSVRNAYMHQDTLICDFDSLILFSTDRGLNFDPLNDSLQMAAIRRLYIRNNRLPVKDNRFRYGGKNYYIKELFGNNEASVIVCKRREVGGPEVGTDYYFVSFDKGNSWSFLEKSDGDNWSRFLLNDKFLFSYDFPRGLQKLKLK